MHPVLARYLDPAAMRDAIRRVAAGEAPAEPDRHLAAAARAWPDEVSEVLRARENPSPRAQNALLFLATHAALHAAREDPRLSPAFAAADRALEARGAQRAEIDSLCAQLLAEEAFSGEGDPEVFDAGWIREGLEDLPALVALDEARVEALLSEFSSRAPTAPARAVRGRAARALLEAAWAEGIGPISSEHLDEALAADPSPRGAQALQDFVEFLCEKGLMGRARATRLGGRAGFAARRP